MSTRRGEGWQCDHGAQYFTVRDARFEHLAAAARENGLHRFVAEVLPQNRKMLGVFNDAGYEVTHRYEDGVISLGFDIDPTERSRAVMEAREHRAAVPAKSRRAHARMASSTEDPFIAARP